ncbi:hypothetical protein BV22DRAFT_422638 [Leucogyrophana mollusca]|uniref:Uncharacterized protein n=1 Tax=Leucogyrophana mollusca TaxID=85980 RepID=A0ACB8BLC8_9AGAM|nr:hypothetical protein BV22DRAFT_422638 [Leucogyrophana mollusca]
MVPKTSMTLAPLPGFFLFSGVLLLSGGPYPMTTISLQWLLSVFDAESQKHIGDDGTVHFGLLKRQNHISNSPTGGIGRHRHQSPYQETLPHLSFP